MEQIQPNVLLANRFLIVQPLSDDAACDTYLAVDQTAGSAVMIRRIAGIDEAYVAATETRSKLLTAAVHPVLPKVFDTFRDGRDLFIVFEQIPGESLDAKLAAAGKPFPPSWVMFWADQLLDALNYLHSHKPPIIHGGVSLSTIKLSEENHAVLSEFGDGVASADKEERSDIRDLSASLYELLTCEKIPSEAARLGSIANSGADPVRRVSEMNAGVSDSVAEVIGRGISISPNERFNSASEMQKALRRAYSESRSGKQPSSTESSVSQTGNNEQQQVPHLNAAAGKVQASEEKGSITMDQTVQMAAPLTNQMQQGSQADVKTEVITAEELTVVRTPENMPPPSPNVEVNAAAAGADRTQRPAKKKSSNAGLIVGLFFGFILIGSLLALGAWFGYGYYVLNVANKNATPTPIPTVTPSPTPAFALDASPTVSPEPSPDSTTDQDESNTNEDDADARSTPVPSTARTPQSNPQQQRPDTRPSPSTQRTPRPQSTPAPKQTPKQRDDRTVILQ